MACGRNGGRQKRSQKILLSLKRIIIAIKLFYNKQFDAIEQKTRVKAAIAQNI